MEGALVEAISEGCEKGRPYSNYKSLFDPPAARLSVELLFLVFLQKSSRQQRPGFVLGPMAKAGGTE